MQDKRPENPAKTYLRRYRLLLVRRESLLRTIEEAYDRATGITSKPKEVSVTGGPAASDRMAEDVARIMDGTAQMKAVVEQIDKSLAEILTAIDTVPDETQKTVLTLRYVEGASWQEIQERMSYESSQIFVFHGRGLMAVKKWLVMINYLPE